MWKKGVTDALDKFLQRELCQNYNSNNTAAFLSFGSLLYLLLKYTATAHTYGQEDKVLIYGLVFAITLVLLIGDLNQVSHSSNSSSFHLRNA